MNLVAEELKIRDNIMEIIKLVQSINRSARAPVATINTLIERKEESLPVLVEVVRLVSCHYKRINLNRLDYLVACYILSQWREKSVFPHLIKLTTIPRNWVDRVWGDFLHEGLASFLVSTFDGNIQALKKLAENEALSRFGREVALDVLVGLVAEKILTREEVLDYFKALMKSDLAYDYEFSASIIRVACNLYPQEVYQEIVDLFERDLVDTTYIAKKDVERIVSMGKEKCLNENLYGYKFHLPINNAIEEISYLPFADQSEGLSKIGRNELCYCGSNKKYKKCCISFFN